LTNQTHGTITVHCVIFIFYFLLYFTILI
jgi:hypothetical protein